MTLTSSLSNGRTVIPAALREQLNIKDGDQLLWEILDGQLTVTTRATQLRKAQARFQSHIGKDSPSLADELINERRAEASRP